MAKPELEISERLRRAGLRPTAQREALARLLFDGPPRHLTAEQLHQEARTAGIDLSLATVYNTLHRLTEAGALRRVPVENGRIYFDTDASLHHHFLDEDSGQLLDLHGSGLRLRSLPAPPRGMEISGVDIIVRVRPSRKN